MTIEMILIVIMSIAIFALGILVLLFRQRYRKMVMTVAQLILDKEALLNSIDKLTLENSKEANEGFIKFLSDSREAAFTYIENVQQSIQTYLDAVNSGTEDEIITARMELFSHLPETTDQTEEE